MIIKETPEQIIYSHAYHEIRSPLMSLKAGIELLKRIVTSEPEALQILNRMQQHLQRVDSTTEKLLNSEHSKEWILKVFQPPQADGENLSERKV